MPTIPTHSVVAIIKKTANGQRLRTQAMKFAVAPGADQATMDAAATIALDPFLKRGGYTVESLTIKALKPAKHSVKVNEQHEYITTTAIFLDGRLNLTVSFGGVRMSGDFNSHPLATPVFRAFDKLTKQPTPNSVGMMLSLGTDNSDTVGAKVKRIAAIAEANNTFEAFAAALIKAAE